MRMTVPLLNHSCLIMHWSLQQEISGYHIVPFILQAQMMTNKAGKIKNIVLYSNKLLLVNVPLYPFLQEHIT